MHHRRPPLHYFFFTTGSDAVVHSILSGLHREASAMYSDNTALIRCLDELPPVFSGVTESSVQTMTSRTNGADLVVLEAQLFCGIGCCMPFVLRLFEWPTSF